MTEETVLARNRVPFDWKRRITAMVPFGVLVLLVAVVTVYEPNFMSVFSIRGLLESLAPLLLLALGQMFVILTGGIDLSFAVTASFGTVLLGLWLAPLGGSAIIATLLVTSLIGMLNGFIVARFQVPSFIVTLGALGMYSGLGLWISGASTIRISAGYEHLLWITDLRIAGLPVSGLIALALAAAIAVAMRTLKRGRLLHAVGMAEPAVLMSGRSTFAVRLVAFTFSGLFSGLAAVVLASSQHAGSPTLADSLLLPGIAAVIIGGTAITGGVGGALRTIIGALIIVVLRVGMTAVGIDPAYEQIVYGAVVIGAVVLTIDRSRLGVIK